MPVNSAGRAPTLRGPPCLQPIHRGFEDGIFCGCRAAELDVRLFHGQVRVEPFAVDGGAATSEVPLVGEPQASIFRQLYQLLNAGAAKRVLSDQIGPIAAAERSRERFRGAGSTC